MDRPVYITGFGAALPERVLANEQIEAGMPWLDTSAEWIREHTGIRQRHVARPEEHSTDFGYRAAVEALHEARCDPAELDLVLFATNSAQYVYPAGAALIQGRLGAGAGGRTSRTAALDVQQGCASFVASIALATAMIRSGACKHVLVVGADVGTRMVDWTDRSAVLLGDGGAACVLSNQLPTTREGLPVLEVLASVMRTVPDAECIFQLGALDARNDPFQHMAHAASLGGRAISEDLRARLASRPGAERGRFFSMDGKKVYRFVRRTVAATGYLEVMQLAGLIQPGEDAAKGSASDPLERVASRIDRFVPHGANLFLNQELADQMRIPYEKMAVTLPQHGNTSSASVGLALHALRRDTLHYGTIAKRDASGTVTIRERAIAVDRLRAGNVVLLLSFGAGVSWNYVVARALG